MKRPVRVLFVADGPAAGGATAAAIGADPAIEVLARCASAVEAVDLIAALAPDVVLLYASAADPGGRALLERAAAEGGAPVLVADARNGPAESYSALRERVRGAGAARRAHPARPAPSPGASPSQLARGAQGVSLIAIGASTGGVEALVRVLSRFPADTPPTVVVQHMPALFTASFAARLDSLCAPTVREAWDGAPLERGCVYVAPGGPAHLEVQWIPARRVRLTPTEPVNRHRPSVDVAFASIARAGVPHVVAALLTGMGRDGAEGLRAIRAAGGRTIAQDRDSSTVYGMPRAALEIGAVDHATPLGAIADAIFSPDAAVKEAI